MPIKMASKMANCGGHHNARLGIKFDWGFDWEFRFDWGFDWEFRFDWGFDWGRSAHLVGRHNVAH